MGFVEPVCCGTVMIYCGSGSCFEKGLVPVPAPVPPQVPVPVPDSELFSNLKVACSIQAAKISPHFFHFVQLKKELKFFKPTAHRLKIETSKQIFLARLSFLVKNFSDNTFKSNLRTHPCNYETKSWHVAKYLTYNSDKADYAKCIVSN
jgi:hypothetical protein